MNNIFKKYFKYFLFSLIVIVGVIIDQVSKYIVVNNIDVSQKINIIDNLFYITHVYNDGGAWSILSGQRYIFILTAVIALVLITYSVIKSKSKYYDLFSAIFLAGLIGNLIDRILIGKVIDFIGFIIFGYYFPIFNFADIFLVIGVILLAMIVFKEQKDEKNI